MATEQVLSTFKQLEERQVEVSVFKFVWSTKMDILALALESGDVVLYRLNWQKIWTFHPPSKESKCRDLVWRPDGKVLCVGYSCGMVTIFNIESGEKLHANKISSSVSALTWIRCPEDKGVKSRRGLSESWDFLTKFPLLSKAYSSNVDTVEEKADCQKLNDGSLPNVLLVGSDQGEVMVFLDGYFLCSRLNLSQQLGSQQRIQSITLSSANMSTFSVICQDQNESVKLVVVSMPLISSCFHELSQISVQYSVLQGILSYLEENLKQISEAWEGIVVEFDAKLEKYAAKLPAGAMSADFLDLLVIGIPSAELEHFLLQDLTEKGLKKMISSIDASYLNVQKLVVKYLLTVIQSLNFFLSEIAGLSLASEKLELLGLTGVKVEAAKESAAKFWLKATELQQVIDGSRKKFKIFFNWLHLEILKLSGEPIPENLSKISQQEVAFIAEFLSNFDIEELKDSDEDNSDSDKGDEMTTTEQVQIRHKHLEKVGQYLTDAPLDQPIDRHNNKWNDFLELNPDVANISFIVQPDPELSLVQAYAKVKSHVNAVFEAMNTDMTSKCQTICQLNLEASFAAGSQLCAHQFDGAFNNKILGCLGQRTGVFNHNETDKSLEPNRILFYEIRVEAKTSLNVAVLDFDFPDSPAMKLIDAKFYVADTLSLLLNHSPVSDKQRFIRLPLSEVQSVLSEVDATSSFSPISLQLDKPDDTGSLKVVKVSELVEQEHYQELENIAACLFDASPRKVAAFLFSNMKRIRIYDMEVEEEDDDDDDEEEDMEEFSSDLNKSES